MLLVGWFVVGWFVVGWLRVMEAAVGVDQRAQVVRELNAGGGVGHPFTGQRRRDGVAAAARIGGVGVRVEHCQLDHATVVQDPQAVVEQVTGDLDLLAGQPARRFPLPAVSP